MSDVFLKLHVLHFHLMTDDLCALVRALVRALVCALVCFGEVFDM